MVNKFIVGNKVYDCLGDLGICRIELLTGDNKEYLIESKFSVILKRLALISSETRPHKKSWRKLENLLPLPDPIVLLLYSKE